jgi:ferric-dicitrate binding protein FerR (iron transport regulator)
MGKSTSRFAYLFGSYLENNFKAGERKEFMDLVCQEIYNDELNSLIEEAVQNAFTDRGIGLQRADQLFEKIMQTARVKQKSPGVPIRRIYPRWVAAVSLMVFILASSYFLFFRKAQLQTITAIKKVDEKQNVIEPAGNKAILTLDNGSTIILDSAQNGTIASQSNTKIIKLNSETLIYRPEGSPDDRISFNTIHTPRGGQFQIVLPDKTKVWLNAASSLKFPSRFSGKSREVTLSGEAYFEVARNKTMPFIVSVMQTSVTVLGTHFNINGYNDESDTYTTLLEGSVKFSHGNIEKMLHPGQQARFNNTSTSLLVRDADVDQVMSWKNGFFEFDSIDLHTIMRQISRWYDVDIFYQSITKDIKLGGGISRKLNLYDLLRLLENSGVHSKLEGRKLFVST